MTNYTGLIDRYRNRLALAKTAKVITLYEGNTPLLPLQNIAPKGIHLFAKFEGLNPTGSFKDRGMTVAVSDAVANGAKALICASTGNTSASAAAYAARAGIDCCVLIPEGKIALGKLAQAMMHGAKIIQIKGNFDDGMSLVKELARTTPLALVNSVNPMRIEGQKTAAFEICDALGAAPDYHCLPVGNAGNITAYWKGYTEYFSDNITTQTPRMCGYQALGAAPFLSGGPVANPETVATAIRIGNPQSWDAAIAAQSESEGWFHGFSDETILKTQSLLAAKEGIFCEPASAISVAGALDDIATGKIEVGSTVVCTLTGHGLKDPDIAISQHQHAIDAIDATLEAVTKAITA